MRALKYQNQNGEIVNTLEKADSEAKVILEPTDNEIKQKPTKKQYAKIMSRILGGQAKIK